LCVECIPIEDRLEMLKQTPLTPHPTDHAFSAPTEPCTPAGLLFITEQLYYIIRRQMAEDEDRLIKALNRLERSTRRSTNLGWSILRGIFYSFGWAIGLALLATIAIYILPKIGEGNAIGRFIQAIANIVRGSQQ